MATSLVELRVLDGANLYFSRAAVKLTLDVSALSALYAGGVPVAALHAAGRVQGETDDVAQLARALASFPAPSLDIWY